MFEQARTSHSNDVGFLDISRLITRVALNFSTGKLESTYLTPARAKVKTSSARNAMHLQQIIMSSRMSAPGISCSKETVILDSCLIITETTEHSATCAHHL